LNNILHVACNYHYLGWVLHENISYRVKRKCDGRTDIRTNGQTAAITISPHRYRGGIITRHIDTSLIEEFQ
jgi:hypothetical protein